MSSHPFLPMHTHNLCLERKQDNRPRSPLKTILNDINISINNDGITAIMGANGAGKTALLKCCLQLNTPTKGAIKWHKQPTSPEITFVPQRPVLLDRNVLDNIHLPLKHNAARVFPESLDERCNAALQWANIDHLAQQAALSLSGGEQQLLALARAWALKPSLLFLDEPCANLDPTRNKQINQLIQQLSKSCKIVMTSHNLEQVQLLAKDVILLDNGSLITQESSNTFFMSAHYKAFIGNSLQTEQLG